MYLNVFLQAYQATKDAKFSAIVEDILTYVKRDLSHPLGPFYSAEDADSKASPDDEHKREGAFCVWTHQQLTSLLKKHTFQGILLYLKVCEMTQFLSLMYSNMS